MSRLDLAVGPNGAGKSTFVRLVLASARPGVPFVNADLIAARLWPEDPSAHAYDAARKAAETRSALISRGQPFIAETVFSHPSKLDLVREATAAGFDVRLHALMVPVDLAVARVSYRVLGGGHDVPEAKVRERYDRLWPFVAQAVGIVPASTFWANHTRDGPLLVATFYEGVPATDVTWPGWVHPHLPAALGGNVMAAN